MRVLITGVLGTLGRPLARELTYRGHYVGGVDLMHSSSQGLDFYERVDVGNYRQLVSAFRNFQPEVVYHLAAEFGRFNGEDYYEQLWSTNAVGTKNVLNACQRFHSKMIFASSSEIYGEQDFWDTYTLDERLPERVPTRQHNDYAISKWVNELQIRNQVKLFPHQEIMTLRFFNAYGPGEYYHPYRSVCCLFAYRSLMRLPITVFENYHRVFMYIDDFIPTLANACERFKRDAVINIGGCEYRAVTDLHSIISGILDLDPHREEVTFLTQDGHNTASKYPVISLAKHDLGHDPVIRLEDGIERTVEWMRVVYGRESSVATS